MGGDDVEVPAPSAAEKQLQEAQAQLLQQQSQALAQYQHMQELLTPHMFGEMGLKPQYDAQGQLTGFEEQPDELKDLRKQSEKGLLERSLAAQRGELPVNPQLMNDLAKSESMTRESLRRSLGSDYEATTGGQGGMGEFMRTKEGILEGARRGDITLGEQLSMARGAANQEMTMQNLQSLSGIEGRGGTMAQLFGQGAGAYSGPLDYYQNQRQMEMQAQMSNAQNDPWTAALTGIGQLGGQLGSAYLFGGMK